MDNLPPPPPQPPVQSPYSKFCPSCGNQLDIREMNCHYCGVAQGSIQSNMQQLGQPRTGNGLVITGWILATIGSALIPLLALGSIIIGITLMTRGRVGHGIGILLVSVVVAFFAFFFWIGFTDGFAKEMKKSHHQTAQALSITLINK